MAGGRVTRPVDPLIADPLEVALRMASILEACDIRYLIGGSLASSIVGEPRSTIDIDIVVALTAADVRPLLDRLGREFYADEGMIRAAVDKRACANLLHYESSIKIDLFVVGGTPLDEEQMTRRQRVAVSTHPDRFLYVYAAEDILLQKLRWFRMGGETSDRQWRDVMGIVRVQAGGLDAAYMMRGAAILRVEDLLTRALAS